MIELTEGQRRRLKQANGAVVRAMDPDSKQVYILLRAEVYEKMRQLLETEIVDPSLYEFDDIESAEP